MADWNHLTHPGGQSRLLLAPVLLACGLVVAELPGLSHCQAFEPDPVQQSQAEPEAKASPQPDKPVEATDQPAVNTTPLLRLLEQDRQIADDDIDATPLPPADKAALKSREARALFMAGRSYEADKKYREAYESYRKAVDLDPEALAIYKVLIPLAFRLEKTEEGIQLARKAVELDPNNFELLSQLGIYALRQQDVRGSINFFQRAVESQTVDKKSGPYVSIMSQLGQLYLTIGDNEQAAQAYEIVFDALSSPEEFRLDFRTIQALESLRGSKSETYEALGELFLATNRLDSAEKAFLKAQQSTRGKRAQFSYPLARVLAKREDYAAAEEKLQEYFDAKLTQKGRGPYLLLAELLSQQGRAEEITEEFRKLAEADPDNQPLQLYLAERYIVDDRLEEAQKIYSKYEELEGDKGEIQLGLLQIHRKLVQAEKTLKALTQAMLNGASNDRLEAEMELIAQNEKLADEMIELALERKEGDDRELFAQAYLIGKLAMQRKQHEAVVEMYQRAMGLRQERQILLTLYNELIQYLVVEDQEELATEVLRGAIDNPSLTQFRQAFQLQLIRVLGQAKKVDQALEVIKSAQESDPDNLLWEYQIGWVHYMAEEWEAAITQLAPILEKARQQNNEGIEREVRYNLSRAMAFAGLVEEALDLMDQSSEAQPENMLWQFQKGWLYYYSHQWPKAIEEFKKLIAQEDKAENPVLIRQAKFSLSAAYVQNQQYDEGEQVLEKIYEKEPDNPAVCNDLGYLYADRGKKLEKALSMITLALEAEPDNKAYLDSMGWVLYRLERYEEAREYLERAVEDSDKGDGVLWDHLGDCYHKLNLPDKAREAWKTALEHERNERFPSEKLIKEIEAKLE